jgi:hypothetical protein
MSAPRPVVLVALACLLALVCATAAEAAPGHGDLVISELRLAGPDGPHDGYVEVTNGSSVGQSTRGLALTYETSTGNQVVNLPKATLAPGANLLYADAGYSLTAVAAPDRTVALDGDVLGVKLSNGDGSGVLDRVGTKAASAPYRLGSGLPATTTSAQFAWVHQVRTGRFTDAGLNLVDYQLVTPDPAAAVVSGVTAWLGAPGPLGATDAVRLDPSIQRNVLDGSVAPEAAPNIVDDPATSTITIRRRFTNRSSATLHDLAARITEASVSGTSLGQLGVRLQSAPDETITIGGTPTLVHGAQLAEPPSQPNSGGVNSRLTIPLPVGGLAPGASVLAAFRVHRDAPGALRFAYQMEAVEPSAGPTIAISTYRGSPRDVLNVTGGGWPAGDRIVVRIGDANACTLPVDEVGNVAGPCTVPLALTSGDAIVSAYDAQSTSLTAGTDVLRIVPKLSHVGSDQTGIGGTLELGVVGFAAGRTLAVTVGGAAATTHPATVHTDDDGQASFTITIPDGAAAGVDDIRVADPSDPADTATATVNVAHPVLTIAPASAAPSTAATFSGTGFLPNATVSVRLGTIVVCTQPATATGTFTRSCTVPGGTVGGTATFTATQAASPAIASAPLTIVPRFISASPSSLGAGEDVTLSVEGFTAADTLAVTVGATTLTTTPSTVTTAADGTAQFTTHIPADTPLGSLTLTIGDGAHSVTTTLNVITVPTIAATPSSAQPGATVTVSGSGYPGAVVINIALRGITFCTVVSNTLGTYSKACVVPANFAGGTLALTATTNAALTAHGTFTITPIWTTALDWPHVSPGYQQSDLQAAGFPAGAHVTISLGGVTLATPTANANGSASAAVTIPGTVPTGAQGLVATDGTTSVTKAYTVYKPTLTIDPTSLAPGDPVTITGTGWPEGQYTSASIGAEVSDICVLTANSAGALHSSPDCRLGSVGAGTQTIRVAGDGGIVVSGDVTVTGPGIVQHAPDTLTATDRFDLTVAGFPAGATLTLALDGTPLTSFPASTGAGGGTFHNAQLPLATAAGEHTLTVSDGDGHTVTQTITVPSTPA